MGPVEGDERGEEKRSGGPGSPPEGDAVPSESLARMGTHQLRPKGEPRRNPEGFGISLRSRFGSDQQFLYPGSPQQSMRGFEDHYVDIVDFIVRATHRIWEEKDVGYLYDHYRHNIMVVDDYGVSYGRDKVIANTIQFINAFPDIRLLADEIVWAGDDEVGFHTSHRTVLRGTNTGYSQFGPPTGREVEFWLTANCIFVANENYEEWVIYNTSSMLRQLGFDLKEKARELGSGVDWEKFADERFGEPDRLSGQGKPAHMPPKEGEDFDVEDFVRRLYHYVWNWRRVAKIRDAYAPNVRFFGPTDRQFYGRGNYQSFVLSVLAMFPDLALYVDDFYWMGNDEEGYVTSVRWSIVGTHKGYGIYGPPTGRPVYMWGITQHYVKDGRILEEWMMFNEFEVMQQINHE